MQKYIKKKKLLHIWNKKRVIFAKNVDMLSAEYEFIYC